MEQVEELQLQADGLHQAGQSTDMPAGVVQSEMGGSDLSGPVLNTLLSPFSFTVMSKLWSLSSGWAGWVWHF